MSDYILEVLYFAACALGILFVLAVALDLVVILPRLAFGHL